MLKPLLKLKRQWNKQTAFRDSIEKSATWIYADECKETFKSSRHKSSQQFATLTTNGKVSLNISSWLYAFCREYLFRDDTEQIARALLIGNISRAELRLLKIRYDSGFCSCCLMDGSRNSKSPAWSAPNSIRRIRRAHRRVRTRAHPGKR